MLLGAESELDPRKELLWLARNAGNHITSETSRGRVASTTAALVGRDITLILTLSQREKGLDSLSLWERSDFVETLDLPSEAGSDDASLIATRDVSEVRATSANCGCSTRRIRMGLSLCWER